jgi:1-pyrroline-5-carboxylate dehydrogenase
MGDVTDLATFMGAVIDEASWTKLDAAIAAARASNTETVLTDAAPDRRVGYFVPPTLIETRDLGSRFMAEEFFGPIVTAFVYEDGAFEDVIGRIDETSLYGLTGSIFARDGRAVGRALDGLRFAAGNVYVNDKSTGAVVGQQPFGGARASGTNDKAGSMWNLARWVSPRTIKETFVPPTDYRYPSMG